MTGLRLYWAQRSLREQRLLIVMIALLVLVLGWLLVARPLIHALDEAKLRHGEAVIAVAEARTQANRDLSSGNRVAPPAEPIAGLVRRTAAEAGFGTARIAGQGPNRAGVAIDSARAQAFFAWIEGLERQGVKVERLRASPNPDRTLATETLLSVGRP